MQQFGNLTTISCSSTVDDGKYFGKCLFKEISADNKFPSTIRIGNGDCELVVSHYSFWPLITEAQKKMKELALSDGMTLEVNAILEKLTPALIAKQKDIYDISKMIGEKALQSQPIWNWFLEFLSSSGVDVEKYKSIVLQKMKLDKMGDLISVEMLLSVAGVINAACHLGYAIKVLQDIPDHRKTIARLMGDIQGRLADLSRKNDQIIHCLSEDVVNVGTFCLLLNDAVNKTEAMSTKMREIMNALVELRKLQENYQDTLKTNMKVDLFVGIATLGTEIVSFSKGSQFTVVNFCNIVLGGTNIASAATSYIAVKSLENLISSTEASIKMSAQVGAMLAKYQETLHNKQKISDVEIATSKQYIIEDLQEHKAEMAELINNIGAFIKQNK